MKTTFQHNSNRVGEATGRDTTVTRDNRHGDRPRVLLIAEAANPNMVSVPLVGWSHAEALSRCVDVHLVTQIRNRKAILEQGWVEGREFTAIDSEWIERPLGKLGTLLRGGKGKGWTIVTAVSSIAYFEFERQVWRQFGPKIRRGEYDLVHRLTPLTPTASSTLARKCVRAGVPFILGPLNGGLPWPTGFIDRCKQEREWLTKLRNAYKLLPGYSATRRNAAAILVASRATYDQMPDWAKPRCLYIPENGIDPARFNHRRKPTIEGPLRVLFLGRLVPYKGADMLIRAAAEAIRKGRIVLTLIGDGPQRPALEALTLELGLTAGIKFAGWVDHREINQWIAEQDVMALPSIREFGGGVVLEAMAAGVLPIVADYGGPAELLDDRAGIRILMDDQETLISNLQETLEKLELDRERLNRMCESAWQIAQEKQTWAYKAKQVSNVYKAVLTGSASGLDLNSHRPDWMQGDLELDASWRQEA